MEAATAPERSATVGVLGAAFGTLLVALCGVIAAAGVDGWDVAVAATAVPFLAGATWVDLQELRIPNRLNAAFAAAVAIAVAVAAVADGSVGDVGRSLGAAVAVFAVFLVLHAVNPDGFGGGDVKLGFATGAVLGWMSWSTVLQGVLAAFLINGVAAVALLALSRGRLRELPFGPSIALGALLAIAVG